MRAAALLSVLFAASALAQATLEVSSPTVVLTSSEARSLKVEGLAGSKRPFTVEDTPSWLTISSTNNYTTPDTLYFQIASSICGTCTVAIRLVPASGSAATTVTVRFAPDSMPTLTQLAVSPTSVNLNSTLPRSIQVSAPKGASVTYALKNAPSWVTVTSAHNYTTPDTLYFQVVNSNCGTCKESIELLAKGSDTPTKLPVAYGISAGSSYRATPNRVTLTYPAAAQGMCGPGYMSRCTVDLNSSVASVKTFSAKTSPGAGDSWLLLNDKPGLVSGAQVGSGLTLSLNENAVSSLATGEYSGQVVVFNPANQSDLILVDVSLLVNPGKITISPDAGVGNKETFTLKFPHPGGWQNLAVLNLLINGSLDLKKACYLGYAVESGKLHLTDDEGDLRGTAGEILPGTSGKNGQCGVRFVSAQNEGNLITLTLELTFNPSFAGKKTMYLAARDKDQNNSGWLTQGTWEIRLPAPVRKKSPPAKKK